ncbi:fungal-specific transcription factor domain-containing protein [Nemania diffusa]|nr:fungal-specific transcription factor domain-containing protein [Nemania diffusa]
MLLPTSPKRPFKRTRTGCLTCREDGYKCDEQKPSCGRCMRLEKQCQGYGLRLKWQSPMKPPQQVKKAPKGARSRKASSTTLARRQSLLATTAAAAAASPSPRAMSSGIAPRYAYLLGHWANTLASLITMAPTRQNLFHVHVTPMITESPALRSAICFMAARHLSVLKADPLLLNTATELETESVSSLWRTIDTANPLVSLAVVMVLQITNRLFTTNSGINHLKGAKGIIERAHPRTWDSDAGIFLLSVCSYHDAIGSVSRGAPPVIGFGGGDIPFLGAMAPVGSLKMLWLVIGQISSMNTRDEGTLDGQGRAIELALRIVDTASREGDAAHTIHAYKEAAYIYLHRFWQNVGSPHPRTLKHARDCLQHLLQVPVESALVAGHPWPLWTAACETIDGTLRDQARRRVRAMYEYRHLPSLERLEQDLEEVWRIKDEERAATGIDKVDCVQAVLTLRHREADLE